MIIGVPKEIKLQEHRIGLTPDSVKALTEKKHEVLIENNGGFASSRLGLKKNILKGVKSFIIRIKGDGNSYKLRLSQDNRRASYSANFKSINDEWIDVSISIEDFTATWRGYTYNDYPSIDSERINSLGLQISDKQEGKFKLEIEYIKAVF